MIDRADLVVVGAGIAGAATAYHLARAGVGEIVILEREPVPGAHASGRNAGLVRRALEDALVGEFAVEGAERLRRPPADDEAAFAPESLVRETGSLLLAGREDAALAAGAARAGAVEVGAEEAQRLAPDLAGAAIDRAWYTALDGVADIHALLGGFLRGAVARGARVATGCAALAVERGAGGAVAAVRTSAGRIATGAVVDAAGAWAGELARSAGAAPPPLRAFRRHLFSSAPREARGGGPWVWDVERGFYFREEGPGLLLSACDQEPHPAAPPAVDPARAGDLAEKLLAHAPALAGLRIARAWACLRTFAPDGRFVIGPEPALPGYFYAAGLGGHGITTAFVFGALAAEAVLRPDHVAREFARERFA